MSWHEVIYVKARLMRGTSCMHSRSCGGRQAHTLQALLWEFRGTLGARHSCQAGAAVDGAAPGCAAAQPRAACRAPAARPRRRGRGRGRPSWRRPTSCAPRCPLRGRASSSACRGPLMWSSSTRPPRPWSPPPSSPWCWAASRSGTAQLLSAFNCSLRALRRGSSERVSGAVSE